MPALMKCSKCHRTFKANDTETDEPMCDNCYDDDGGVVLVEEIPNGPNRVIGIYRHYGRFYAINGLVDRHAPDLAEAMKRQQGGCGDDLDTLRTWILKNIGTQTATV